MTPKRGRPAHHELSSEPGDRPQDQTFFRPAIESAPVGVVMVDAGGKIVLVNRETERMFGYAREELLGQPIECLLPKRFRERHVGLRGNFLTNPSARSLGAGRDLFAQHKDGTEFPVEIGLNPVVSDTGLHVLAFVADIRVRKQAEQALHESEQRYRVLFETNPMPSWVFDRETLRILAVNDEAVRRYGYSREEFLELTIADVQPPEDVPALLENLRMIPEGFHKAGTWRHRKKNGTIITVEINRHPLSWQGRPAELSVMNDVSERLQVEQDLRDSELRFRQLAENMREVFFLVDSQFRETLYISPAYEDIWGRSLQSAYSSPRSFVDAVAAEDRERLFANIARAQEGQAPDDIEFRVVRPDGTTRWVLARSVPVRNERGEVYRIAGVASDVTARKQAEELIRHLSQAVEQSPAGVVITDTAGTIQYMNRKASELTGYTVAEAVGKNPRIFKSSRTPPAVHRELWETITGGKEWRGVLENQRKDDRIWWNAATVSPIRNVEGTVTHFLAIQQDVTEQRLLEDQFRQAQKMEAVGRLAGGVAHDFNNLLTVISSYSELLLADLPATDPRRADLEEIHKAAGGAAALTRQLLAFSRKQVLQPTVLDLNAVVAGADKMLRRLIGEDIDLVSVLARDLGEVRADAGQVEQVIMNLAVNARDAMPAGGKLTIETANVELDNTYAELHRAVAPGAYVLLSVSDGGTGMDEQTKAHVFEPFFTTKEQGKGTGLGLATVYGIVKQSGGYIWVYSELGRGTVFKIYFPRVEDAASAPTAPTAPTAPMNLRGTETVLVAEDAAAVRAVVQQVLGHHGYHVLAAADSRSALELGTRHDGPVHLLVTDVVMPEMSGRQLADRLQERRPTLKVLFVSGYTDDAITRHGILEPGIAFLQKPFTPESLARKVREVLDT